MKKALSAWILATIVFSELVSKANVPLAQYASPESATVTRASQQINSLTVQAMAAFRNNERAKGDVLFQQILTIAETNRLGPEFGSNSAFRAAYYVLTPYYGYGKKDVANREWVLRILRVNGGTRDIARICEDVAIAKLRAGDYPGAVKDAAEAEKLDPTYKEMNHQLRLDNSIQPELSETQGGDLKPLTTALDRAMPDSNTNTPLIISLLLKKGDVEGARKHVLLLEKIYSENADSQGRKMPGSSEFSGPESRSPLVGSGLAVSYHLKLKPNDEEIARNALQLIISFKESGLDNQTAMLRKIRTAPEVPAQQLRAEYSHLAASWAKAAMENQKISNEEVDTALSSLQKTEKDVVEKTHAYSIKEFRPRVTQVQEALGTDDSLIEFAKLTCGELQKQDTAFNWSPFGLKVHYVAYVLRHDGSIKGFDLGPASEIDSQIQAYRSLMQPGAQIEEVRKVANNLYRSLWKPLADAISTKGHAYISPDSNLNLLPFDGLVDDDSHYLIQNWQISYLTSGKQLATFARPDNAGKGIIVFAAPNFREGGNSASRSAALAREFKPLPYSLNEGKSILQSFPDATLFTGAAASESRLKAISNPKVLHLATHGYYVSPQTVTFDGKHMSTAYASSVVAGLSSVLPLDPGEAMQADSRFLRSGLVLSEIGTNGDTEDGIVTSLEIALLNLDGTELVILSACDSGVGDVSSGGSVSGLRSAFHIAGAKALISSLWKVDDAAGAQIMQLLYENLVAGMTINEALRHAKLALMSRPPYFWASFVLEGKDKILFPSQSSQALYASGYEHQIARDYIHARDSYELAAEAGNVDAMYTIGALYFWGQGVTKDYELAYLWFKKGAESGSQMAMYALGSSYLLGQGVDQDSKKAQFWYEKAADAGNANAMYAIGTLYQTGANKYPNYVEAAKWYRKAADAGCIPAMTALAALYEIGAVDSTINLDEARRWYEKAATAGDEKAKKRLTELPK